jgi:prevent-host-death family protein
MTVSTEQLQTDLPSLLDRVAQGERVTITRDGVPMAVLVPASLADRPDPRQVIEEIRRFRKGRRLDGLTIRQLIEEGRRY